METVGNCFECDELVSESSIWSRDIFGKVWCEHCWPEADPRLFGQ